MRLPGRTAGPRPPRTRHRELRGYRTDLVRLTTLIARAVGDAAATVEALRIRAIEPDEGYRRLSEAAAAFEAAATAMLGIRAPTELHGLHREYEANLHRARRGLVLAERACRMADEPYRPPADEEVLSSWRRGGANLRNAALRMNEVVHAALHWEPGRPAEVSVATRLEAD